MSPAPAAPAAKKRQLKWRMAGLALVLGGGFVVAWQAGWLSGVDKESIRDVVRGAGAWGVVVFTALFALAELVHVPGALFVGAAQLLWGPWLGALVGWFGCVVSVTVSFWVVRGVGGRALTEIDKPWMHKALAWLERAPLRTIVVLRAVFWVAPPLNYLLALSSVRFRDYFIGSAVGLVPAVVMIAFVLDWFMG